MNKSQKVKQNDINVKKANVKKADFLDSDHGWHKDWAQSIPGL